jgi:predicted secreted protein
MSKNVTVYGKITDVKASGIIIGGRKFILNVAQQIEVSEKEFESLQSANWFEIISDSLNATDRADIAALQDPDDGTTAQRPAKPKIGQIYFDTTLSKPIWCKTEAVVAGDGTITTPAVWVEGALETEIIALQDPADGITADRPTKPKVGQFYFDTTLSKPIWCKTEAILTGEEITTPAVWIDSAGTEV